MLSLKIVTHGEMRRAALDCEEAVFLQAFGNSRQQLDEEYGPYGAQSVFLVVCDETGLVYGQCRLITPGPSGLKTLNDVRERPWGLDVARVARIAGIDPSNAWDIATLGVRSEFRGRSWMISLALYHGILRAGRVNGVTTATAILDDPVRQALNQVDYVMPTLPGASTAPYLGSASSTPVYAHSSVVLDAQRRRNPDAYRLMSLGIGLDGIHIPEDNAFVLTPAIAARRIDDVAADAGVLLRAVS